MSPALLGFLRGIAFALIVAVLTFVGDASHLTGLLNPESASVLAALALALEHVVEAKTGSALFGTVQRQTTT
jgi:hypothetical protein